MQAATHRRARRGVRIGLGFATLILGAGLAFGQVDWGVIEDGDLPPDETPLSAPPLQGAPAAAPAPAPPPQAAAPAPKTVAPATTQRARKRGPTGYAYRPKRPELAREFPLETVDVSTLLSVQSARPGSDLAAGGPGFWAPAELPLIIDEPRPLGEPPPAEVAKAAPVAAPPVEYEAPAVAPAAALPVEETTPLVIEEEEVQRAPEAVDVTRTEPVLIEEAAPPEPVTYGTAADDQPLLIEEPPPVSAAAPAVEDEQPLVIEAAAPADGMSAELTAPQEADMPTEDEQPLIIEEAPPQ